MIWRVVFETMNLLDLKWRMIYFKFTNVLTGKTESEPRWENCIGKLSGKLGIGLANLYVRNYFSNADKSAVLDMIDGIEQTFVSMLKKVDWMDSVTKESALEKADSIRPEIGFPKELTNDTLIEEFHEKLNVSNTFFDNYLSVEKWSIDYYYSKLRQPNIKGE